VERAPLPSADTEIKVELPAAATATPAGVGEATPAEAASTEAKPALPEPEKRTP